MFEVGKIYTLSTADMKGWFAGYHERHVSIDFECIKIDGPNIIFEPVQYDGDVVPEGKVQGRSGVLINELGGTQYRISE